MTQVGKYLLFMRLTHLMLKYTKEQKNFEPSPTTDSKLGLMLG